jgi:PKD repeat protein
MITGRGTWIGIIILLLLIGSHVSVLAENTAPVAYKNGFPKTEYNTSQIGAETVYDYGAMRPSDKELTDWYSEYRSLSEVEQAQTVVEKSILGITAMSLLEYVPYTPSERNQGLCGNCWVWASTGALEVTHSIEYNAYDRLSIQYFNSRYNNGGKSPFTSTAFACNGGNPSRYTTFYNQVGQYGGNKMVIPWSNKNAQYLDGNATTQTLVSADRINTTPNYSLKSLSAKRIQTSGVSQAQAIANIKNMIDNGKAVYLAFVMPDQESWSSFLSFWTLGYEDDNYFQLDQFAGKNYQSGYAHAVLVTGYIDDGSEGYWQCLNSFGAPANRPNGLFYINMYMDYSATILVGSTLVPITEWEVFDTTYAADQPSPSPNETPSLLPDFSITPSSGYPPLTVKFTDISTGNATSWKWDFGDNGGSQMHNPNHTYAHPGKYSVTLTIGKSGYSAVTTKKDAITVKVPYVTVSPFPSPDGGFYPLPTDPNGDGRYEDINGNGFLEFEDPLILLRNMDYAMRKEPVLLFDFDRSGFIGYGDVVTLRGMV